MNDIDLEVTQPMTTLVTPNFDLYQIACDADDRYQAELIAVYGKRASERRYQLAQHQDVHVQAACDAKRIADALWLAEMRRISTGVRK